MDCDRRAKFQIKGWKSRWASSHSISLQRLILTHQVTTGPFRCGDLGGFIFSKLHQRHRGGGIYGIGGGAIIAPFFFSFFGLPIYTVAGAALMGTFVTSVAGVIFYQAIAPFYPTMSIAPDWLLGALFGLGGIAGMYLGARCQKYFPAKSIKWMLSVIIVFTTLNYVSEFFK